MNKRIICENYENNILPYLQNDGIDSQYHEVVFAYGVVLLIFTIIGFVIFVLNKNKSVYSKQKTLYLFLDAVLE